MASTVAPAASATEDPSAGSRQRPPQGRPRDGRRRGAAPSLVAAAIPTAIGVLLVVFGWLDVSNEAAFDDQSVGLNLAILGAIVVGVGCGFYLWAFRLRLQRRVRVLCARHLTEFDDVRADGD